MAKTDIFRDAIWSKPRSLLSGLDTGSAQVTTDVLACDWYCYWQFSNKIPEFGSVQEWYECGWNT